ncbi:protein kinase [Micromonospora sp. NPDC050417]|uniref:protein kinase domain-containing protein n=1 Tax=Micromonospora sp. NPDC050417 TaxID=3364280 RepID=UPI00379D7B67
MTQIPTWSGGPVSPTSGRAAPGATIGGRYSLRAAVGHGGMGTVWRAADTLLRRDVAVKEVVLPPGLAPSDRDAMYERTLREARAAAALQHPAVVQVYDVVTEGGRPWIVMELLDARSLADMVIEDGPLAPRAVAKIGIALLGALEVAHAIGVLHRDVKPANVLIASDGRCVLTDFGVARMPTDVQLTTPGMVLGSPHFISPERAMGHDFGPPSDLFSLGVTLYTAVEGRPPFDRGDPIETMHAVVEDPPAPPSRSGPLTEVLMGLLEKDPARRFDVDTSRNMLRELLAGPLASNTAGHLVTDPYSVVPAQRATWQPPAPPAKPQPTGQIGGSAMLAPGESLTDRLAQLRKSGGASGGPGTRGDAMDETRPGAALRTPTGAMPAAQRWDESNGPTTYGTPGGAAGTYGRSGGSGNNGAVGNAVAGARRAGDAALSTIKSWPRKLQLAAAGGVVAVLVIGIIALSSGDPEKTAPLPQAGVSPSAPAGPAFPIQAHAERGISVNVPEGWKKNAPKGALYIDFTDPADSGRRIRILIEKTSATPLKFLESAGGILAKPDNKSCVKPYAEISLQEVELSGKPAAELEYTCGDGDTKRHGIWRAVVQDGKAYEFYLTTPDAKFEESKPIFDELVRSFTLTPAG